MDTYVGRQAEDYGSDMGLFRHDKQTAVPPTWLAWPTLKSAPTQTKTAGVFYHQDDLKKCLKAFGPLVMAELRIEMKGEYAGAVRVFVDGKMLGSLPAGMADDFRPVIAALHESGQLATCRALLEVARENFDVWLSVQPENRPDDDPFLTPFSSVSVTLYEGQAEALEASLNSKAKTKKVTRLGQLAQSEGCWLVAVDGVWLGGLERVEYPLLDQAQQAGLPLTCNVRLARKPDAPFSVEVDMPIIR
jgi:hypothetical protein